MTVRRAVDFLIVVALQPELEAAIRHFGPVEQGSGEYFATVPRRGGGKYQVAIVNIGDMGPESAQRETNAALSRLRVNRVILIGIAAGFPESGVEYGDLMLPLWIVDYEKSKVSDGWWGLRHLKIQDRGHEFRVNQALYHAAQTIAASTGGGWGTRVSVPRPDGSVQLAGVRHGPDSAIGSGSKLVASRLFSTRKRLVAKGTLGVEMEAIGVVHACLMRDTPVLVLKASQDYATSQKDAPKEKDKWRAYACDVAAAFARELVEMFVVSHDSLIAQHLAKLDVAMQGDLSREIPHFVYCVRHAQTLGDVMRRHFVTEPQPIAALTPNESAPLVALLGGGGTGKSNIARRLVQDLMEHEKCPVLLDLKNYHSEMKLELASAAWSALTASERSSVERDVLESVLFHATVPRRSRQEMEMLAAEMELVSIVDGLNEIPPTEQKLLLDFLRSLSGDSRAYVVVTARLGLRDNLDGFTFAVVDRLSESEVQEEYDRQFGDGAYAHLEATVQQILRRPFFLALAMRGSELAGLKSWSGIFERFFSERIKLHSVSLRALAENVFESFNELGTFDVVKFKQLVVEKEYENLVDAEVLSRHDRGFDHELWRDFLAAKHLSQHSELWVQDNFDRVTTKASSFECFPLTIEQIADPAKRDAFVKTVYDWSVAGAVECLYYAEGDDRGDISPGLRVAMLAVIAEKQFDRMENTRIKALSQLRGQRSEIAGRFTGLTSRGKLVSVVADTGINDAWFNQWFAMFSTSDLSDAADTLVQEVESLDSVLGWTAANVIKRLRLDASQLSALCDSYVSRATDVTANAIRWRVVHALGAFPEAGAIATLEVAAKSDPSMWVRYGATRSLIEIAAMGTAATRPPALKALFSALPEVKKAPKIERRRVLLEALNAAFVRGAAADWDDDALPLLSLIVELAEPSDVSEFSEVLRRFESKEWPR